ncbi:putative F-box domain-containing protein [Neospora caninum Liverpool]|uniref:F-box domain-containing protein, putative n=1 Tax=Neospora caninum (strain Liverpool) TaxID=572307 RepID=F0VLY3_NEOCL|nr:putative F-box domain-containing protein [Neospora caninum Liverpool]CBZ54261.1 putative F-box domain-containing protein [Neospora caninum Liverpool]CEL68966.1 TPA: F-box domain-containing protein, putative [Neospora caninum Liverpool]|eukprot:XP_003884292.1 putative F-box domain-containing protein [Neospora caninum Liverpool]
MEREDGSPSRFSLDVKTEALRCHRKRELEADPRPGRQPGSADEPATEPKGLPPSPCPSRVSADEKGEKKPRRLREELLSSPRLQAPAPRREGVRAASASPAGKHDAFASQQTAGISSSDGKDQEKTGQPRSGPDRTGEGTETSARSCIERGGRSPLEGLPSGCMYTLFSCFDVSQVAELRLLSRTIKAAVDAPCSLRGCTSLTVTSRLAATARRGILGHHKQRVPSASLFWWRMLDRQPHLRRLVICRDALGFFEGSEQTDLPPSHALRFLLLLLRHSATLLDTVKITSPDLQCHRLVDWGVLTPQPTPSRARDEDEMRATEPERGERRSGPAAVDPGATPADGDETEEDVRETGDSSSGEASDKGEELEEGGRQAEGCGFSETSPFAFHHPFSAANEDANGTLMKDRHTAIPQALRGARSDSSLPSLFGDASSNSVSVPDWFCSGSNPPSPASRRFLSSLDAAPSRSPAPWVLPATAVGDFSACALPSSHSPVLSSPLSLPATTFPQLTSLSVSGCHAFFWLRLLSNCSFPSCRTFSLVCQCPRVHVSLALGTGEKVDLRHPLRLHEQSAASLQGASGEAELVKLLLSMPLLQFLRVETRLPVSRRVWRAVLGCTYTASNGEERRFPGLSYLTDLAIRDRSILHLADVVHEIANAPPQHVFPQPSDRSSSSEDAFALAGTEDSRAVSERASLVFPSGAAPRAGAPGMPRDVLGRRCRCRLKRLSCSPLGGDLGKIPSVALASLEVLMRAFPDCQFVLDNFAAGCVGPAGGGAHARERRPEEDVAKLLPRILGNVQHLHLNFDDPNNDIPLLADQALPEPRGAAPALLSSPPPVPLSASSLALAPHARRVSIDFLHFSPDTHRGLFRCRFGSLPPAQPASSAAPATLRERCPRGRRRCRWPSFCVEGLPEPESASGSPPCTPGPSERSSDEEADAAASPVDGRSPQRPCDPRSGVSAADSSPASRSVLAAPLGSPNQAAHAPGLTEKDWQLTIAERHVLQVLRSAAFPAFLLAPQRPPRFLGFAPSRERRRRRQRETRSGEERDARARSFLARRRRTQRRIDADLLHALCRDDVLRERIKGIELRLEELADSPRAAALVWALVDLQKKKERERRRCSRAHAWRLSEGAFDMEGTSLPASMEARGRNSSMDAPCGVALRSGNEGAETEECGARADEVENLEPPRLEILRLGNHRFGLDELPASALTERRSEGDASLACSGEGLGGRPGGAASLSSSLASPDPGNAAGAEGEKLAALLTELLSWYPELATVEVEVPPFLYDDEEDEAWREEPPQLRAVERLLKSLGFVRSGVETLGASMYEHVVIFERRAKT